MVGNVQFLAELMRKNLINLGIAPRALVCLIIQFFKEYILYEFEKKDEYSIYLYQFEYIIRFVETLGKEFEEINKN